MCHITFNTCLHIIVNIITYCFIENDKDDRGEFQHSLVLMLSKIKFNDTPPFPITNR